MGLFSRWMKKKKNPEPLIVDRVIVPDSSWGVTSKWNITSEGEKVFSSVALTEGSLSKVTCLLVSSNGKIISSPSKYVHLGLRILRIPRDLDETQVKLILTDSSGNQSEISAELL